MPNRRGFGGGNIVVTDRDFYEVLGVGRDASLDDIKKAYRESALKYHPDRNQENKDEAETKFKEATAAYQVLSDDEQRRQYDQFGHAAFNGDGGGFGGFDFGGGFAGASMFEDVLGDLFGDFFGAGRRRGGGGRQRGMRGDDFRYDLDITFDEAVGGTEKRIEVPRMVACEPCKGSGARAGTEPETCSACEGAGQIRFQQGLFQISKACGQCNGEGKIVTSPCPSCRGIGRNRETREIKVKVPGGVDDGSRLKLRGEGEAGMHGGPTGDLYVVLHVEPHDLFEREGSHIICQMPIGMAEAALGCKIDVPTLDGLVKMSVPAGTQTGKLFRLRGKGVTDLRGGGRGDQVVRIVVETPTKLGKKQRKLLEEYVELEEESSDSMVSKFSRKVRDLFGA